MFYHAMYRVNAYVRCAAGCALSRFLRSNLEYNNKYVFGKRQAVVGSKFFLVPKEMKVYEQFYNTGVRIIVLLVIVSRTILIL